MLEQLPISRHVISQPVRRFKIGSGDQGTRDTLELMAKVIKVYSQDYYVRRWAEIMVSGNRDPVDQIHSIFLYIKNNSTYAKDPDGIEYLKTPKLSLQLFETRSHPMMDCDDYVVLSLSLLKSIGFPVAIRAAAYTGELFEHVYGLALAKDTWYPLDLTQPYGIGWEASEAKRIIDWRIK